MRVRETGAVRRGAMLLAAALALVCRPGAADEVMLDNGDRLTGQVVAENGGALRLATDYAGVLTIDRARVRAVRRDASRVPSAAGDAMPASQTAPVRPAPPPQAKGEFDGHIAVALESERGNNNSDELDADLGLRWRRGPWRLDVYGELENDSDGENGTTAADWELNNQLARDLNPRWYAALFLQLGQDRRADLRARYLVGPLLGVRLFDRPGLRLDTALGPMLLQDHYTNGTTQEWWGPGWQLDYEQVFLGGRLNLYHSQLGSIFDDGDQLWQAWSGVKVPLPGGFFSGVEYEVDYESKPAPDTRSTDQTLRVKLGLDW